MSLASAWSALRLERDQLLAKLLEQREVLSAHVANFHRNMEEEIARRYGPFAEHRHAEEIRGRDAQIEYLRRELQAARDKLSKIWTVLG